MAVHQFPGRSEYHIDALFGVVDKVTENNSEALKSIPLDVKILISISLYYLKEERHPLIECLIETEANHFVVNTVCPTDGPQT